MGDGGFWHNGLTNGVANAMYNRQDSVLVILDNFYPSATGQHHNPSTGTNARKEPTGMTIPQALRGVGVSWIRTVDSYDIPKMIGTLRDALTTRAKGLKVVIARGECQLERQRRLRPLQRTRVAAGETVVQPRFGVDDSGLVSLLIPAVGGQGGGVLSEWIVEAAALDGYRAQGTSIPGVAQRTGSTTYYVELVTDRDATEDPAFSLYPVPGALDVLLAPEFLEVGRMIEAGFVSPGRTTVVCSTHRLYTIHEKTATGGAIYPRERLDALARATARRLVALDALVVARERGTEVNAVLLGALAGSGALPVGVQAFRKAIEIGRASCRARVWLVAGGVL